MNNKEIRKITPNPEKKEIILFNAIPFLYSILPKSL